jgi:hypothetical protein
MLNWFKTTWNFAHPATNFSWDYLSHPVNKLTSPINPVCKLGNNLSWLLAGYLILRGIYLDLTPNSSYQTANLIHGGVLVFVLLLSLLNFNVTIYLLPIILSELYRLRT